ncbi:MAG: ImmA/IrrE family metallo-endopeptidase [Phycisphaerae bacterium]|nr:ImmA/IrrE family metallo-endopeptidase [Phycisphaerae bacterium]NUQ47143.1 ImmA/IrrE family metallo-endopeptidase [Phycisphaerae bacterium]
MTRVSVSTDLLQWAMERAGRSAKDLEPRFPKLARWLDGRERPTLKQLEEFARATHAPFGYFFLPQPPVEDVPIPDFRTIPGAAARRPSPDLLDTIYICQQRQEWYREYARITGERPFPFVGSVKITDDAVTVAADMGDALAFDLDERRQLSTWTDALRRFIEQADNLGVLVMVSGVVGSNNRRKLDPREFRGFALCDPLAPLVFINGADTRAGQMFTLAHELAHLWLGESALTDVEPRSAPTSAVEQWCNRVAAELLAPLDAVRAEYHAGEPIRDAMDRLARRFKVSTLVILRRIHDAGGISREQLRREYDVELDRLQHVSRARGGGDFYLTTAARVSRRFARALVSSTWEGRSSFTEAFGLLGFKKMSTFRELGQSVGVSV